MFDEPQASRFDTIVRPVTDESGRALDNSCGR